MQVRFTRKGVGTMMGGFGSGFGGWAGLGLMGMILNLAISVGLIVGLVLLVVWLWRRLVPGGPVMAAPQYPAGTLASPKEILQIRYVRGEITREQYQQMLADLG